MQIVLGKTRSNVGDVEMVNEVFQRRNTGKKYIVFPEIFMFSIKTRVFVQVFIHECMLKVWHCVYDQTEVRLGLAKEGMEKELVTHGRGSEWVEGGKGRGTKCWLSVKFHHFVGCRLNFSILPINDLTDD